jgi:hypothetical protein
MAFVAGSSRVENTVSTSAAVVVVINRTRGVCFGFREGDQTFGAVGGRAATSAFEFIITVVKMDYSNYYSLA